MKESLFWLIVITVIWLVNMSKKAEIVRVENPKVTIKTAQPQKQVEMNVTREMKMTTKTVVDLAKENLGKPYVYGQSGPDSFDCSGFVYGIHKQMDIILPRTSLEQSQIAGSKILREALQEGDLVFFDTALEGYVNHSGIYLGNSEFIHASSGKAYSVTISSLDAWYKDKFKWGKRLNANK